MKIIISIMASILFLYIAFCFLVIFIEMGSGHLKFCIAKESAIGMLFWVSGMIAKMLMIGSCTFLLVGTSYTLLFG